MKNVIFAICLIIGSLTFSKAQTSLNNYKYIIVPKQFDFQNSQNQYRLNTLTSFLFKEYGFKTIYEGDELPSDLKLDYCLALNSNIESKGAFITKTKLTLKDCNGKTLFTSKEATTKEKNIEKAYSKTIREAFKSLESVHYSYTPKVKTTTKVKETEVNIIKSKEIEKLKAELKELKEEKEVTHVKNVETKKAIEIREAPLPEAPKQVIKTAYLIAKDVTNGYELISSDTKSVKYVIQKTAMQDIYTIKNQNGIIYKKDEKWILEYSENGKSISKTLNIKF
jgi:hypothetical protein